MQNDKQPSREELAEFLLAILPDPPSFVFENHGSLCILRPLTPQAEEWINEFIGPDNGYQPQYPSVLIEPRYVEPILQGIADAGMSVAA
jgi:hypothetical protein